MSIKVMCLIWKDHTGLLTGIEKSVLLRLADFAADDGSSIYPGYSRLVKDTGFSARTIQNTMNSLIGKGIIKKVRKEDPKTHRAAVFFINVDRIGRDAPEEEVHPTAYDTPGAGDARGGGAGDALQPSLKTIIKNHHLKNIKKDLEKEFEEWWQFYPKRVGKLAAYKSFCKARESVTLDCLVERAALYGRMLKMTNSEKYTKNPTTWLNGGHWEDDYSDTKVSREVYSNELLKRFGSSLTDGYIDAMIAAEEKGMLTD